MKKIIASVTADFAIRYEPCKFSVDKSGRTQQIINETTDNEPLSKIINTIIIMAHVSRTVWSCFNVLRQIRSIRRSVTRPVFQSLVVSLVLSRLDYGNAALAGLPTRELSRLQTVQNAGARLIFFGKIAVLHLSVSARTCSGVPAC